MFDFGKLMSVLRSVRIHRFTPLLLLICLSAWASFAHAAIGFRVSLNDSSLNNPLTRPVSRGLSSFQPRAILDIGNGPRERSVVFDSTYSQATLTYQVKKTHLLQPTILSCSTYVALRYQYDTRQAMRDLAKKSYKSGAQQAAGGQGIAIDLPYRIKSKTFKRLFGGDNVGVRVSGNITINGNIRNQKFDELQAANMRNTNTSFRIDMVQRFTITGKVGQKVEVKVDQDSERLFDFENSLKLTYAGDPDEIVQKVEAGNVSFNLAGPKLATFSGRNNGLFGLKTETKVGALRMTGIATLERGQKNRQSARDQAQHQQFSEKEFVADKYFWITAVSETGDSRFVPNCRENYRHFRNRTHISLPQDQQINNLEVYVSTTENDPTQAKVRGRATALQLYDDFVTLNPDSFAMDVNHVVGVWRRLEPNTDYSVDKILGTIRLRQRVSDGTALACAFDLVGDTTGFGTKRTDTTTTVDLVLLRTKNPDPRDSTWNLMFRHVYDLGVARIDPTNFKLVIVRGIASGGREETSPVGYSETYLQAFGFDKTGQNGEGGPDGFVDDISSIILREPAELHFLDLTPFDPSGYFDETAVSGGNPDGFLQYPMTSWEAGDTTGFRAPYLYSATTAEVGRMGAIWRFVTEMKGAQAVYKLGPLVLEGSEEVTLNGQALSRGSDYTIDYMSGELRILNEQAKASGAALEITYESGRVFQLDKTTLLGARAEYDLWQDAYIGGMILYLNQKTLDRRVRIGSEPIRNTLWDFNTSMKFKPDFLSRVVEAVPLVHTTTGSEITFDAEVARVYPNPNSLENARTGDFNGLAYIDDFEGARRSVPLGLNRRSWSIASIPVDSTIDMRRGRLVWYNPDPRHQVGVKEVFPEREVNSSVAQTLQSLKMIFAPDETDGAAPQRSWGGVMRYLGEGYTDQSRSQFLEFWIQLPRNPHGKLIVDLGTLSEDALPDGKMNSEDRAVDEPDPRQEYGNGVLSPEEDTGIDRIAAPDPDDKAYWNGLDQPLVSSYDNWSYSSGSDDFSRINGIEGNRIDEGGGYPDTEDLNNNNTLDQINAYFSYTIDLASSQYIVGGQTNVNGWRLFRLPIRTDDYRVRRAVNNADLAQIKWARLYLTDFDHLDSLQIVQMDIVSNEWLPAVTTLDSTEYVSPAVINTHENPGYFSPPGVEGEIDPVTQLRQREQSLVLKINQLDNDTTTHLIPSEFFVAKNLYQEYNLLEYKQLKMFVHGGDSLGAARFPDGQYQFILRLGLSYNNINNDYYEVITDVKPGWDPTNHIAVTMNDLSMMSSRRNAAGVEAIGRYAWPNNPDQIGDSLVVKGNPSLGRIGFIALGVRLLSKYHDASGNEIWVDELRVSDIYKDPGTAAEVNAGITLADFITMSGGYRVSDADFHNVNVRVNSTQANTDNWRGNIGFNLHKLAIERWGFRLPVSMSYNRATTSPRILPGTDTRINPDTAPDSIKTVTNGLQIHAQYSKTAVSKNTFVKLIEPLTASWDYMRDERRDQNTSDQWTVTSGAALSYGLPTSKGEGLRPFWWAQNVPILKLLGNPPFYYKPTRIQVGAQANKRTSYQQNRPTYTARGDSVIVTYPNPQRSWQFNTNRSLNAGFAPLRPVALEFSRMHKGIIDTTGGWVNLTQFDFGRTNEITQNVSGNYNPEILSWFKPTFSYAAGYAWANRNFAEENGQGVSNTRNMGVDVQLDFRQILGSGEGRGNRGGDRGRGGRPGTARPETGRPGMENVRPDEKPEDKPGPEGQDKPPEMPEPGHDRPEGKPEEGKPPHKPPVGSDSLKTVADTTKPAEAKERKSAIQSVFSLVNPLRIALTTLDPVSISFDNTTNHSQGATIGQANLNYQLGFSQRHGLRTDLNSTETVPTRRNNQDITARSGLKLSRDIRTTFNYAYRVSENLASSSTGNFEQTMFWMGGKSSKLTSFPFVDLTMDWSGLERIKFISNVTKTVGLSSGLSNRMRRNWSGSTGNVTSREYTQQWNPLIGVNVAWKGDIDSQMRFNTSHTYSEDNLNRKNQQSDQQISGTVTYTFRYGFKLPLLFMRSIHLQNQTSFSLTGDYRKQKHEATEPGSTRYAVQTATSSWSLSPRMTYTFSNTVTGQAYVQLQQTKNDVSQSKSRLFEFGIQVNISIRG